MDGNLFEQIGSLPANGGPAYAVLDHGAAALQAPSLVYRVRQVDTDGRFSYSPLAELVIDQGQLFRVEGRVKQDTDMLEIRWSGPAEVATLRIYNLLGQSLWQSAGSSQAIWNLPAETLPAGWYFLELVVEGQVRASAKVMLD